LRFGLKFAPAVGKVASAGGKELNRLLEPGAGGKVLLCRPPELRKPACKEETRMSNMYHVRMPNSESVCINVADYLFFTKQET
jgi:hypothetical protein